MPEIYNGTQSYGNLLGQNAYGIEDGKDSGNKAQRWPLSFLRTGNYWNDSGGDDDGYVIYRLKEGDWWTGTSSSDTRTWSYRLSIGAYVNEDSVDVNGFGNAIRCLVSKG